jgi:tetratricopeptide (TPR) repeat protein
LKDLQIAKNKKVIALFTALLFVSHPLATQSVTYIVQRLTSIVAMFYLLSLVLYVKARLSRKGNVSKGLLFAGSFLSAVFAMLVKENAFTLPFAIVLFEIFFLQTRKLKINFKDYRIILSVGLFISAIVIIPLNLSSDIFKPIPASYMNTTALTPINYLFTQFSVIVRYIRLLFLPINQNLDYDFPISTGFFELRTLLSFLVLLSLIILAIISFRKYRYISFGICWFFLTLSVESSFIPIRDVIFEHRTYLPSIGFFLILTTGIYVFLWNRFRTIAISLFFIIICSNSYLTFERNKIWKDELSLWSDVVQKSPDKARALYNLAMAYDNIGQWDRSIGLYSKAIANYPGDLDAFINRAVAYGNTGQWDKAITDYTKAIDLDPDFVRSYFNRGIAYGNLGQWENALKDDSKVINLDLKNKIAYYNRGIAYGSLGQWDKAIADQSHAIDIDPNYGDAYNYRGIAFGNLKQWDKSISDFSKTIEIQPKYARAYYNRGNARYYMRSLDKAISDYTASIELDPRSADTYYNRGGAYGLLGQWGKAISDYNSAIEIDHDYSAAYASRDLAYKKLKTTKK